MLLTVVEAHRVNQFVEIGKLLSELMKSDFLLIHLLHPSTVSYHNKAALSQAPYNHILFNYLPWQAHPLNYTSLPTTPYAGDLPITSQAGAETLLTDCMLPGEGESKPKK